MHGGAKESNGGVKIGGCDVFGSFIRVHTALKRDPNLVFP